jgi:hypothetical protein
MKFGFYPHPFDKTLGELTIFTLEDLPGKVHAVADCGHIENDWLYAPPGRRQGLGGGVKVLPYSARVFGLPHTHDLTHASSNDEDHLRFLIQCLGFFVGMRMSSTEAGFLDATPIRTGKASDMVWMRDSLEKALGHADAFWLSHAGNRRIEAAIRGIIHSYFLSRRPTLLDFEIFTHLYVALEGCHYVHAVCSGKNPRGRTHSQRIADLCKVFAMTVPPWADSAAGTLHVAVRRNETLHEGLFFDEPLGFQIYGGKTRTRQDAHVLLEMAHLVSRFVLALLGMAKSSYVASPVDTRQMMGVEI